MIFLNMKKNYWFLFLILFDISMHQNGYGRNRLDVMQDFAYPSSTMQSVQHCLAQALYFVGKNSVNSKPDFVQVAHLLQQVYETLACDREFIASFDDVSYMHAMLDQIDQILNSIQDVDDQDELHAVLQICSQLQSQF